MMPVPALRGFFERAGSLAPKDPRFQLFVIGRYDELAQLVRSEGLWGKPASAVGLEALAFTRDWRSVVALYDARPAGTDICRHADGPMMTIHFATALKSRGRANEAARLLPCTKRRIAIHAGGPIYSGYYPENYLVALNAQILALEGKGAAALREMQRAYRLGFWTTHARGMSVFPAFDPYRSTPEYAALDTGLKRRIAAERAQVLRAGFGKDLK